MNVRASIPSWWKPKKLAADIDIDLLWESCGEHEFGFEELAAEYFGANPNAQSQIAVVLRIVAFPMYFYKKGRGRYKAAPAENVKAALAGLERKQREAAQMAEWQAELVAGNIPEVFVPQLNKLLHRPDKKFS